MHALLEHSRQLKERIAWTDPLDLPPLPHCDSVDAGERRMFVRLGGWLDSLAAFDAAAFRLSTRCVQGPRGLSSAPC